MKVTHSIAGASLCAALVLTGCGSTVIKGADGDAATGGKDAGGGGDIGGGGDTGGAGGADGCDCETTEICHEDTCYPRRRIDALLVHVDDKGLAILSTNEFSVDLASADTMTEGDCVITTSLDGLYESTPLDLGSASLQVDDAQPMEFPPFEDGKSTTDVGWGFPLDPAGGETTTFSWTGGADIPAASISFSTTGPVEIATIPPMIAGEPWTLDYSDPAPEASLSFEALDGGWVTCFSSGSSITVPGTVTALVDTTFADDPDLPLILRPDIAEDVIGDDIHVSGIRHRGIWLDIPSAP